MSQSDPKIFPSNFLWGSATSSHQVEGDNHNDWSEWEKENAGRLASLARQNTAIPELSRSQAADPANYISGKANDHYHLFRSDLRLAKELNHNAYRFSIEWSRIEPKLGEYDQTEIAHYREMLATLKELNMEPVVTLWHFTLPVWAAKRGGWRSNEVVLRFAAYATMIAKEFKDDVKYWITLNEPVVYADQSYLKGNWPPQKTNIFQYLRVKTQLAKAHNAAYKLIKAVDSSAVVGVAHNATLFQPFQNRLINKFIIIILEYLSSSFFLDQIKNFQDFIGLNYYFRSLQSGFTSANPNLQLSDLGWEVYPEGIYDLTTSLYKKYKKPIMITENGIADAQDAYRGELIRLSVVNIAKALREGTKIIGYLHWSLLDNFEWAYGFWPRFGLIAVDYQTQKRTVRESAKAYAELIKVNSTTVTNSDWEAYPTQ